MADPKTIQAIGQLNGKTIFDFWGTLVLRITQKLGPETESNHVLGQKCFLSTLTIQFLAGWWFGTLFLWLSVYWECHHPNCFSYFSEELAQPTRFSFNTHQPIFSIEPKNANILFGIPFFRFHGGFEELQLCDVQVCQEVYEKYNDKSKRLDRRGLTPGNFELKSNIHHNCIPSSVCFEWYLWEWCYV